MEVPKHILIIEDDTDMREALRDVFDREGYAVIAVENSELGLREVVKKKPDLILLDVMTHSLHASAFLERLRQLPPGKNDSKVIVLTNMDNEITRKKVTEYNVEDFMIKVSSSLESIVKRAKDILHEEHSIN